MYLEPRGGHIADRGLGAVGNPLDKAGGVLGDSLREVQVHLLGGQLATERACTGQVPVHESDGGSWFVRS